MSPRGWRFARDHGDAITYVEADLPAMADSQAPALERAGSLSEHHRVVEIDALADEAGPERPRGRRRARLASAAWPSSPRA